MECKVKSFTDGILVGEIVNVSADDSVITDGKVGMVVVIVVMAVTAIGCFVRDRLELA